VVAQARTIAVFGAVTTLYIDANSSAPIVAPWMQIAAKLLLQTSQQSIKDNEADIRRHPGASLQATSVRVQLALLK
jgi:hypothetical protein